MLPPSLRGEEEPDTRETAAIDTRVAEAFGDLEVPAAALLLCLLSAASNAFAEGVGAGTQATSSNGQLHLLDLSGASASVGPHVWYDADQAQGAVFVAD